MDYFKTTFKVFLGIRLLCKDKELFHLNFPQDASIFFFAYFFIFCFLVLIFLNFYRIGLFINQMNQFWHIDSFEKHLSSTNIKTIPFLGLSLHICTHTSLLVLYHESLLLWGKRARSYPFAWIQRATLWIRSNFGVITLGCLANAAFLVNLLNVFVIQEFFESWPLHRIHL